MLDFPAEAQEAREESFMMFPGNYTWSAAVRGAIATSLWGGSDPGEIHKVTTALKARVGDGHAWFDAWSAMARKVARLAEAAESKGHAATASAAYMRAANYFQTGERLLQPRTEESQQAYASAVTLFKRGIGSVPFLSIEAVEVPFEQGKSLPAYFVKRRDSSILSSEVASTASSTPNARATRECAPWQYRQLLTPDTKAAMSSRSPGDNGEGPRIRRWP